MLSPAPAEPIHHLVDLAGFEVHVLERGAGHPEAVVLWHGLARTARDFDPLAEALAKRWRVLAVDTIGRGMSQWARDPASDYCFAVYQAIALALLDRFGVMVPRWVGTSMGGALGIRLAGGALKDRMGPMVVNDIGPELPAAAVERILAYVSAPPVVDTLGDLEAWLRRAYAPYGYLTAAQWRRMALTSARRREDGRLTLHYDPAIVAQFREHPADYALWPAWEAISSPVLVLRGADSDLLRPEVAARMAETGPRPTVREIPKTGHAPALNVPGQIDPVTAFLKGG
jgi:pimeloyl-ACP methyl ester carboxylesterase